MADIKLPDLGENVDEGDVMSILVAVGDTIAVDQPLLELETGKATVEIPSPIAGVVEEILVSEGDRAGVGHLVMRVKDGTAAPIEAAAPAEEQAPVAKASVAEESVEEEDGPVKEMNFSISDLGDGVEEGDVMAVLVSVGDTVTVEQALLEVETGKATVEIPSTLAGTIVKIMVEEGGKVRPGQPVFVISGSAPKKKSKRPAPATTDTATAPAAAPSLPRSQLDPHPAPAPMPLPEAGAPVRAAPSVRKFSREIGIQIHTVPPVIQGGRISIEDVKRHAKRLLTGGGLPASSGVVVPPLPDFSKFGSTTEEAMSTIRKITAKHMTMCWSSIPHVTQNDKADITDLEVWRKQNGPEAEKLGGKLTLTAILVRLVADALKEFPNFNCSIDMPAKKVIYKDFINIGIAIDTPKGLMVPVIRDADNKDVLTLAKELTDMAVRARDGKISPNELQGGTFTITNVGGIGGSHFTPIINHPEVAILGIGRGAKEAVFKDGKFVPRLMMPTSLSYDHRIIDGADGARFSVALKKAIEGPLSLTQ